MGSNSFSAVRVKFGLSVQEASSFSHRTQGLHPTSPTFSWCISSRLRVSHTPKGGSSRSKTKIIKRNRPHESKRKAAELVKDPMDENIHATGSNIRVPPTELSDLISSHPPRRLAPQRFHLEFVSQAKPIRFVSLALKAMSSSQACTSSSTSPWVLILNDSFHGMFNYKAKHNKFPSTYDDMVVFLSHRYIQLNFHSIELVIHQFHLYWTLWFSKKKIRASREFFFLGKLSQKGAVDLIIAEYPDGLHVLGISEFPWQVPHWNKQVQNFIKFTIGFCEGYFYDDGALLLFYPDNVQIKKEVLSFLYHNNLEVKKKWTIVNSPSHLFPV